MKLLKAMAQVVVDYVKNAVKMKSITRDELRGILKYTISALEITANIPKTVTDAEIIKMMQTYQNGMLTFKPVSRLLPVELPKKYGRTAKDIFIKKGHTFGPIFAVNSRFISLLTDIDKNFDQIFVDDPITIFNTRMSHVAVLGIMRQADFYSKYTSFLWAQVISCNANSSAKLPRYREEVLMTDQDRFIEITNLICDKTGRYTFLNEIDNMKSSNANMLLYYKGDTFDQYVKDTEYNSSVKSYFSFGISALNIFAWPGEMIDNFKHWNYLRNKQLKEWLESHNALLKLQLAGTSPDDPKYRKLENIIQSYDDQIADFDKKISNYLLEVDDYE